MAAQRLPLFQVNAFTSKAFQGNPAAIVLVSNPLSDDVMQQIAAELRLSETAFVATVPAGGDFTSAQRFHLRWFTPKVEVQLCGHATLGTAAVLFRVFKNPHATLLFDTLSGELAAERVGENGDVAIFLPTATTCPLSEANVTIPRLDEILTAVLGSTPYTFLHYVPSRRRLLVRLDDEHAGRAGLEALSPKFDAMLSLHDGSALSSVTVTTRGQVEPYDFCSRHFSPWIGIPEDPVTGSAHSYLTMYWNHELNGQRQFNARQCSPRGGDLKIEMLTDERIRISGSTTLLIEGTISI